MEPPINQIPNLWEALDDFLKAHSEIHASLMPSKEKEMLGDLLTQFKETRALAEGEVKGLVEGMIKDVEKIQVQAQDLQVQVEKGEQEFEAEFEEMLRAMEAGTTEAPSTPEAPINPTLGSALGLELLNLFAPSAPPKRAADAGSVASQWVDDLSPEVQPSASGPNAPFDPEASIVDEPTRPTQTEPPKKKPSARPDSHKDLWESGFSESEE